MDVVSKRKCWGKSLDYELNSLFFRLAGIIISLRFLCLSRNKWENAYESSNFLLFHFKYHGLISFYYFVAQILGNFSSALETQSMVSKCCHCYAASGWHSVRLLIRYICFRLLLFFHTYYILPHSHTHTNLCVCIYFIIFFFEFSFSVPFSATKQENIILHIFPSQWSKREHHIYDTVLNIRIYFLFGSFIFIFSLVSFFFFLYSPLAFRSLWNI